MVVDAIYVWFLLINYTGTIQFWENHIPFLWSNWSSGICVKLWKKWQDWSTTGSKKKSMICVLDKYSKNTVCKTVVYRSAFRCLPYLAHILFLMNKWWILWKNLGLNGNILLIPTQQQECILLATRTGKVKSCNLHAPCSVRVELLISFLPNFNPVYHINLLFIILYLLEKYFYTSFLT